MAHPAAAGWVTRTEVQGQSPASSALCIANDLHDKLRDYRRNGVQKYLVLVAYEQEVCWFNWETRKDRLITPGADGILRSRRFPGLWLYPLRFWQGDVAGLLAVLQHGLATLEHAKLVEALQQQS